MRGVTAKRLRRKAREAAKLGLLKVEFRPAYTIRMYDLYKMNNKTQTKRERGKR